MVKRPSPLRVLGACALVGYGWGVFTFPARMEAATKHAKARKPPVLPRVILDLPIPPGAAVSVDIPFTGSVKDELGAVWTVSGTAHVTKTELVPPVPIPSGIVFAGVTDIFGTPLVASSSGKVLFLKGSGFPATSPPGPTSSLRLTVAGREVTVAAWTPTSIQWGLPNTWTDGLAAPVTGPFEIWSQQLGVWQSLGKGGQFTVLPSLPTPRRKR